MDIPDPTTKDATSDVGYQFAKAVQMAAMKVEKKTKEESQEERNNRIREEIQLKTIKSTKANAKKLVKKKCIRKINSYFQKK